MDDLYNRLGHACNMLIQKNQKNQKNQNVNFTATWDHVSHASHCLNHIRFQNLLNNVAFGINLNLLAFNDPSAQFSALGSVSISTLALTGWIAL